MIPIPPNDTLLPALDQPPRIMGILNVTPDSFSDGGQAETAAAAVAKARLLVAEGADILDLGAESTRPGATPLSAEEEWARLGPILRAIVVDSAHDGRILSVDTRHARTADAALSAGAQWINDVSGGDDPEMAAVAATHGCPIILMHHLGIPVNKTVIMRDEQDLVMEIRADLERRSDRMLAAGVAQENLLWDPGIGFGKSAAQSWHVLARLGALAALAPPLVLGISRKSLFGLLNVTDPADRDFETALIGAQMTGIAAVLRVHNVALQRRALTAQTALLTGGVHRDAAHGA